VAAPGGRVSASPLARRIARELDIDLAALVGSGPNGRVVKRDVLARTSARATSEPRATPTTSAEPTHAEPAATPTTSAEPTRFKPAAPLARSQGENASGTRIPLTRLQQTIARRMTEAKQTAPDFVLDVEVDMDAAVEYRARLKELLNGSPAPTLGDFVIKASALALKDHPRANAAYRATDEVELFEAVAVGVAVAAPEALLVPTVRDADQRSLGQIAADVRRLAARAREGRLSPPEMDGATFTVSNLGMFGIDAFTAVLNPPQAAILAVGAVRARPFARDGQLVVANTMVARLTCDHRVLNGADGAALLARIRELLQTPELLAL
jgi:pyruvate dehydrogenase E2 component (dihydrolipoamide acetyltransferase)